MEEASSVASFVMRHIILFIAALVVGRVFIHDSKQMYTPLSHIHSYQNKALCNANVAVTTMELPCFRGG